VSRLTWFTAGAVTGVYVLLKGRSAARNFTPDGISARAAALAMGLRAFAGEVSTGMTEREVELRQRAAYDSALTTGTAAMIELSGAAPADPRDLPEEPGHGDR